MVQVDSPDSIVPEDKIGYLFAGSELNVSSWVYYNKVAAGALSSVDWLTPVENPPSYRKEFNIIHKTMKIPRMVLIVRDGLDKKLVARIKEELLKMNKTERGRTALKAYKLDKFVEPPKRAEGILKSTENLLKASGEKVS